MEQCEWYKRQLDAVIWMNSQLIDLVNAKENTTTKVQAGPEYWGTLWGNPRSERLEWQEHLLRVQEAGTTTLEHEKISWASIIGDVENIAFLHKELPCVQINMIGTARDTKVERAVLEADVWPYIRKLCHSMHFDLKVLDLCELEENLLMLANQDWVQASLAEARRGHETPENVFTLVLGTNSLGHQPIPSMLPTSVFDVLLHLLEKRDKQRRPSISSASLLAKWYKRPTTDSPVYLFCSDTLASFHSKNADTSRAESDIKVVLSEEVVHDELEILFLALNKAFKLLHKRGILNAMHVQPYVLPVMEQLVAAALAGSHDGTARNQEGQVVGWDHAARAASARSMLFVARSTLSPTEEQATRQVDARSMGAALFEQQMLHLLGGNVIRATVQRDGSGLDPEEHAQALRTIADEVTRWMLKRLNEATANPNPRWSDQTGPQQVPEPIRFGQPGDNESSADVLSRLQEGRHEGWLTDAMDHAAATNILAREFVPVNDDMIELQRQILEYVDGSKPVPMVLVAPSSFSLTCTMAKAAEQAWLRDSGRVSVVARYIHLTSGDRSTLEHQLHSLSCQLDLLAASSPRNQNPALALDDSVPTEYQLLVSQLPMRLRAAASKRRPLIVFVDAVNLLLHTSTSPCTCTSDADTAPSANPPAPPPVRRCILDWVPAPLPKHVRIVVSMLLSHDGGKSYNGLGASLNKDALEEAESLRQSVCTRWGETARAFFMVLHEPIPVGTWMTEIDKWLIREQTFLPQQIREQLQDAILSCPDPMFVKLIYPLALEYAHRAEDQSQLPVDVAGVCQRTLERVERVVDHALTPLVLGIITSSSDGVTLEELHNMLTSSPIRVSQASPTVAPYGSIKGSAQLPGLGIDRLLRITKQERFEAAAVRYPEHVVGVVVGAVQRELAGLIMISARGRRLRWMFRELQCAAKNRYLLNSRIASAVSLILSSYFDARPTDARQMPVLQAMRMAPHARLTFGDNEHSRIGIHAKMPTGAAPRRCLSELLPALLVGGHVVGAANMVCNFGYILAQMNTAQGITTLVHQMQMVLRDLFNSQGKNAQTGADADQVTQAIDRVRMFWKFLVEERSFLAQYPGLTLQQGLNQVAGRGQVSESARWWVQNAPLDASCGLVIRHRNAAPRAPLRPRFVHRRASHAAISACALQASELCSPEAPVWALGSADGSVVLVSPGTGKEVCMLEARAAAVGGTCFSPNGARLVVASKDGSLTVWSMSTCQVEKQLSWRRSAPFTSCQFSPDGQYLLAAGGSEGSLEEGHAIVFDTETWLVLCEWQAGACAVGCARWSPDMHQVAVASEDGLVKLWTFLLGGLTSGLSQARKVMEELQSTMRKVKASVGAEEWQDTGHSKCAELLQIFEAGRPELMHMCQKIYPELDTDIESTSVDVENCLALMRKTWEAQCPAAYLDAFDEVCLLRQGLPRMVESQYLRVSQAPVLCCAWSVDSTHLAACAADGALALYAKLPAPGMGPLHFVDEAQLPSPANVLWCQFLPRTSGTRRTLASAHADQMVRLWNCTSGMEPGSVINVGHNVQAFDISSGGDWLLSYSDDASSHLWDLAALKSQRQPPLRTTAPVCGCSFAGNNAVLAVNEDATLQFWRMFEDQRCGEKEEEPACLEVATMDGVQVGGGQWSPGGEWVAVAARALGVVLFNINQPSKLASNPQDAESHETQRTTLEPSKRLAMPCLDHDAEVQGFVVECCAYSPDGKLLITGGQGPSALSQVLFWELASGLCINQFHFQGHGMFSMACSPDGTWAASCHTGGEFSLRLWDVVGVCSGRQSLDHWCISLDPQVGTICSSSSFSPCGTRIAATLSTGFMHVRRVVGEVESASGQHEDVSHIRGTHVFPPVYAHPGVAANACAYSSDGKWIATTGADNLVKLWSSRNGDALGVFRLCLEGMAIAVRRHSVACGDRNGQVYILEVEDKSASK